MVKTEKENHDHQFFLLKWNPKISSFSENDFKDVFDVFKKDLEFRNFNWSIYQWQEPKADDYFIMLKVGTENDCICLSGRFLGKCYIDDSWNQKKKGKKTHFADMKLDFMTEYAYDLSAEKLEKDFPEIQWHEGHSGVLISKEDGERLLKIIDDYILSSL